MKWVEGVLKDMPQQPPGVKWVAGVLNYMEDMPHQPLGVKWVEGILK